MANGLASLVAALGAGMSGYAQGAQIARRNAREDKLAAQQDEEYAYQKGQRDKSLKLEKDLAASQADQTVQDATDESLPLPMQVPTFKAGGQTFGDQAGARMALEGVNSRASKDRRAADVYRNAGQVDQARKFDEFARQALNEGTDQIIGAIQSTAPSVDAVKKAGGMVAGTVGQQAADISNKTGSRWKVSPDTMVQHYIDKDAAGREFVNSRVLGKDGKPVVEDLYHSGLMLQDYKTRLEAQKADQQTALIAARDAESGRHNRAVEVETTANNRALRSIAARGVAIQESKEAREAQTFKHQSLEGQLGQIETVLGRKLSDAERQEYSKGILGFGKNRASDEAMLTDLTKKFQEKYQDNNPTATPEQVSAAVAKYRQTQTASFGAVKTNANTGQELQKHFAGLKPGSPEYAQTYKEAISEIMVDDGKGGQRPITAAELQKEYGITPPPQATPSRAAALGTATIPSPPAERIWVGNDNVENPAYTEWKQKYGEAAARQSAAANARWIAANERVRN